MAPLTPQQGEGGTELSTTTGASSNTPPAETQLKRRHHSLHHDGANAATDNITLDAQLIILRRTRRSKDKKQHVSGCKCCHIEVHGRQFMK